MKRVLLSFIIAVFSILAIQTPAVFADDGVGGGTSNNDWPSEEAFNATRSGSESQKQPFRDRCNQLDYTTPKECDRYADAYFMNHWYWAAAEYEYIYLENTAVRRVPKPTIEGSLPPRPSPSPETVPGSNPC